MFSFLFFIKRLLDDNFDQAPFLGGNWINIKKGINFSKGIKGIVFYLY